MPIVPDMTPMPKNSPTISHPPRWLDRVAYQIAPKIVAAWIGNQMTVIARYQNRSCTGVSVSALDGFSPSTASSPVTRYHAQSGISANHHPPRRAASITSGTSPRDIQNGKAWRSRLIRVALHLGRRRATGCYALENRARAA